MRLTQRNTRRHLLLVVLISVFNFLSVVAFTDLKLKNTRSKDANVSELISIAQNYNKEKEYTNASKSYESVLDIGVADSLTIYRELAFVYAKAKQPLMASKYIDKYVLGSLDVAFVGHSYFEEISDAPSYQRLADKYLVKVRFKAIFCFYIAFIGFFVAVVLNFRKKSDRIANLLMSVFVLIHSLFMIHISVVIYTNFAYYEPDTLYMSTIFSFLYGPLIYFYFKRVANKYVFKFIDVLHLLPTVILLVVLLPVYSLSAQEKLSIIIHAEYPHLEVISITKLFSLLIYGVLVIRTYIISVKEKRYITRAISIWQRNIAVFCSIYIVSYAIYSMHIIQKDYTTYLFNIQVVAMALLVLYVSYTAFVQPSIFGKLRVVKEDDANLNDFASKTKYEKSGLTPSLSIELKDKLLYLLNDEKVYKQNNITLHKLSELLDTTRHNTSQIINEHFELNFFDLMNTYRINEAMDILKGEKSERINIIDVAYEVGFNNKVTFNKSFKKYNQITPSEYLKSQVA